MPLKRRKARSRRRYEPTPAELAWLYDSDWPEEANEFEVLELSHVDVSRIDAPRHGRPTLRALWAEHGDSVLASWVRTRPGTRPSAWWLIAAPRTRKGTFRGRWYDGLLPEPRARLGGTGEQRNYVPAYRYGLPASWHDIDPHDPPTFEAQASYLERLGLLLPGERERLGPKAFAPEVVRP